MYKSINEKVTNPAVKDQDGGVFWVGRIPFDATDAPRLAGYSDLFNVAFNARCPAAVVIDVYKKTNVLLIKLIAAEALRQSRNLGEFGRAVGLPPCELALYARERRSVSELPTYIFRTLADKLSMPFLLLQYVAGRLTESDLAELDDLGNKVSDRLCELREIVESRATADVQAALARIEAEESRVAPIRNSRPDHFGEANPSDGGMGGGEDGERLVDWYRRLVDEIEREELLLR